MKQYLLHLLDALKTFGFLQRKKPATPIADLAALEEFIITRAAFIAQKTMYGYVQTRMGLNYPIRLQDKDFAQSMRIAKMHVYAACASDLVIWCIAQTIADLNLSKPQSDRLAEQIYCNAIDAHLEHAPTETWAENAKANFTKRLLGTQWQGNALSPENFTLSPKALVEWSPIEEVLKKRDASIVQNSIKFAWMEVRESFLKRLKPEALGTDLRQRGMIKVKAEA